MLRDVIIHPPEQLPIEGIPSPNIAAQILEFCDDGDLFPQASGGGGCASAGSGGAAISCYDDSSFPTDLSPFSSMDVSTLSALFDPQPPSEPDPDIIFAANYPSPPLQSPPAAAFPVTAAYLSSPQDHVEQVSLASDITTLHGYSQYLSESLVPLSANPRPVVLPPPQSLPPAFDDECMSSLSSYMGLEPSPASTSCSFVDPTTLDGAFYGTGGLGLAEDALGFYPGGMVVGQEPVMQAQDVVVEYHGESGGGGGGMVGIYGLDNTMHPGIYGGAGDLQVIGDHQHLVNRCRDPAALASDMPSLEESTFKVGRLSVEERKERIHRYMKKRNQRNFSKKIKYACRKTLADSRPRVRGRFAKNDELGETMRMASGNHEDEDEEEVVIKEEEHMIHSSDMYAHLSGRNTFKRSYRTLESWI